MSKLLLMFALIAILTNCKKTEKEYIPAATFEDILVDLHLLGIAYRSVDDLDSLDEVYWSEVESKYSVSKEYVLGQYELLLSDPEELKNVYQQVVKKLEDLQTDNYSRKYN